MILQSMEQKQMKKQSQPKTVYLLYWYRKENETDDDEYAIKELVGVFERKLTENVKLVVESFFQGKASEFGIQHDFVECRITSPLGHDFGKYELQFEEQTLWN